MVVKLEMVKTREGELDDLHTRMDEDRDLVQLEAFILVDAEGKPEKNVNNVTGNTPATYADSMKAVLGAAEMQRTVEGTEISDKDSTAIEELLDALLWEVDNRLHDLDISCSLQAFIAEQVCYRGSAGARSCLRMGTEDDGELKGKFVPDITPLDTKYFSNRVGTKGQIWGAYRMIRSEEEIKDDYPNVSASGNEIDVVDVWDKEKEAIYIGDNSEAIEKPNGYKFVPFVHVKVPAGSVSLKDKNNIKHEQESIFKNIRELIKEKNAQLTIAATLARKALRTPLQLEAQPGEEIPELPAQDPRDTGQVTALRGKLNAIPFSDLHLANTYVMQSIDEQIRYGSAPTQGYLENQVETATKTIQMTEAMKRGYSARLEAMTKFYQKLLNMAVQQMIIIGETIEIGEPGHKKKFNPSILKGKEYIIKVEFTAVDPIENILNYQISEIAKQQGVSIDTRFRDILHLKDPQGEINKGLVNEIKQVVPALKMLDVAKAISEEKREDKSFQQAQLQILHKWIGQQLAPTPVQPPGQNTANPPNQPPATTQPGGM